MSGEAPGLRDDVDRLEQVAEKLESQLRGLEGRLGPILDPATEPVKVRADAPAPSLSELRGRIMLVTDLLAHCGRLVGELTDRAAL